MEYKAKRIPVGFAEEYQSLNTDRSAVSINKHDPSVYFISFNLPTSPNITSSSSIQPRPRGAVGKATGSYLIRVLWRDPWIAGSNPVEVAEKDLVFL